MTPKSLRKSPPVDSKFADLQTRSDWNLNLIAATLSALLWILTGAMLAGRFHLAFRYTAVSGIPVWAEPLVAPWTCILLLIAVGAAAPVGLILLRKRVADWTLRFFSQILIFQVVACVPLIVSVLRSTLIPGAEPGFWEVLWFCGWSGLFTYRLVSEFPGDHVIPKKVLTTGFGILCIAQCLGWILQSLYYYDSFMLGFNDAGHFSQRVANTATGNGLLLESPALPPFWDHFNPGLLLLVPLWLVAPDVQTLFWLQPIAMASSAWLIVLIAKEKRFSIENTVLWGMAWLLLPVVGQINLAYTYGWHPIVLGIPFLLLSYWSFLRKHYFGAALACLLACSFEEGLIVVVGCFAAAQALRAFYTSQQGRSNTPAYGASSLTPKELAVRWGAVWAACVVSFLLVYAFSGLAEFQAGRFQRLGGTFSEILLSPILNPSEFWGMLLRPRNFAFLAVWFLPALVIRGWKVPWMWLAMLPPFFVLLVWEHEPAQSIAFQYTAPLLPLLFLGCMESHARWMDGNRIIGGRESAPPIAFLVTGLLLSVFLGQFWWSQDSLADVKGRTYGVRDIDGRRLGETDMVWIEEKLAEFPDKRSLRILATGRLAIRFVGAKDVETVGQFWVREKDLAAIQPALESPLLAFDWIILDYHENFQQTEDESRRVADRAAQLGFSMTHQAYGFEIWRNQAKAPTSN